MVNLSPVSTAWLASSDTYLSIPPAPYAGVVNVGVGKRSHLPAPLCDFYEEIVSKSNVRSIQDLLQLTEEGDVAAIEGGFTTGLLSWERSPYHHGGALS